MELFNLDAWTAVAWAVAGIWIIAIAVFWRGCWNRSVLRPLSDRTGTDRNDVTAPRLSVIVAAKNESDCIETCLRSLLRQDYPDLEVVAVNDRSTDDTGAILDRLAREFTSRLHVVHVSHLPSGWFGKPHALNLGLQSATGSVVCFTDADCEFQSAAALRTAIAELLGRQLDFFSVTARYTMTSLRERVLVPCCSEVLLTWLRPERMADPRTPDAVASGAFILIQRSPFERIGGWAAVSRKISEDLELARLAKRSGLRVGLAHGEGLYQTSSYRNLRDSWNGWSRIFKGSLTPAQLLSTLGRMLVMFALPLGALLCGLADALRTGTAGWLAGGAGLGFVVALGCRCAMDVTMVRLMGAPLRAILLAPLGRLFVMAAMTRALLSHAGLVHTHWRGATFAAGELVMPRQAKPEPRSP